MTYTDLPARLRPTPHPVHGVLSEAELTAVLGLADGPERYARWFNKRERLIELEKIDPLRYGIEVDPGWKDARALLAEGSDLLVLGGNRAAKTEFAAKFTVETLERKDRRNVWCFQQDEAASIERLQPYIYRYLPPEHRDAGKKGRVTNVSYTVKNGFSEGKFVLPNASFCRFMSYEMKERALEGAELDLCWCDELVPADVLETLRFRLVTRGGKMLVTFTPLEGYSVAVKQYLEGAKVRESRPAPLLPQDQVLVTGCKRGHMPYILECATPGRFVICFFSEWNPFSDYQNLSRLLQGASVEDRKCRAYGWPTRQIAGAFPRFAEVNVVRCVPRAGTNYMALDPAGARNWFMVWVRVDALGRWFVYREWPDSSYGEWALPSDKADGKAGPAQRLEAGRGVVGYKELIRGLEGGAGWEVVGRDGAPAEIGADKGEWVRWVGGAGGVAIEETVWERVIDPRGGGTPVPGVEDGTSIIDLMAQDQVDRAGDVVGASMAFSPAPAGRVEEGVMLINDLLEYDPEVAVSALNCPRLFVAEWCRNTIYALRTWTGADGEKGATKDPVDCLRYLAKCQIEYVDQARLRGVAGRGF